MAIAITVIVLEMKVPHGTDIDALLPIAPVFGSYVMSFVYLGIYWNNHHHLLQASNEVNGSVLWANLHLLFWLSLFLFVSGWMGENDFASFPTALYGIVLLMASIAWKLLQWTLTNGRASNDHLKKAVGTDIKGWFPVSMYALAAALAFAWPWLAILIYALLAIAWFVPDRRFESLPS